jgi:phospholipid transport system substrate-binding protein
MKRLRWRHFLALTILSVYAVLPASATDETADGLIKRLSTSVLNDIRANKLTQGSDLGPIIALVDKEIMPNVNFQRMTASAVGPAWRQASPEQRQRLQEEFKILLIRTYSGALNQLGDRTITVKPLRASPEDKEVVVRSEIKGQGESIALDYRLEKTPGAGAGWKIYNLNVSGVWLVETYRTQFAQEINAKGLDGLITTLSNLNRTNAKKS